MNTMQEEFFHDPFLFKNQNSGQAELVRSVKLYLL